MSRSFVVPLCYGIIQPFFYVIKREFLDYFCQVLLWSSGTKLGKSAIANSITEDLYGVQKKAIGHINSEYRMMQTLNATTMPQHISEIQTFEFDLFSDVIKASAESMTLGNRYNADQTENKFHGKSCLIYSANGYKASEQSLLHRFFIMPYVEEERTKRAQDMPLFNATIRKEIAKRPLGYEILGNIISKYQTSKDMAAEIDKIRSSLAFRCRSHSIEFSDERRLQSYAIVYFGLKCWRDFIFKVYPKLADPSFAKEWWFHWYYDLEVFIEEVIQPLGQIGIEADKQSPASNFVALNLL